MDINLRLPTGINCRFIHQYWGDDTKYTCFITSAAITAPNTKVNIRTNTNHEEEKRNLDVEAIKFEDTIVEYFPKGLNDIFPNVTALSIDNCGLKAISREDLEGLEDLTTFYLTSNKLKSIPSNLFSDMKKLSRISFYGNNLETVSSKLLRMMRYQNLTMVNFGNNTKIDDLYDPQRPSGITLVELMTKIEKQCQEPPEDAHELQKEMFDKGFSTGLEPMWRTGRLSDFTIVTKSKSFNVHKNVLAIRSSVFDAMFYNEMQEKRTNRVKILDFSSKAVEHFLQYFYIGEIQDGDFYAMEIFTLASLFDVPMLRTICTEIIINNIDEKNALDIFVFGELHNSEDIKTVAFRKLQTIHPSKQLKDELMDDAEELKQLIAADNSRKRKFEEEK